MGPSYANLFVSYIEHQWINVGYIATLSTNFSINTTAPNLNCIVTILTTVLALLLPERNSINFITAVNLFHPDVKHTDTSLAFLDLKVSIDCNRLCTIVHYKSTDSHGLIFVVFIFTLIVCQEFHSLISVP